MWDEIIEQEKRLKIAKTAATAIGLGIGVIILQFLFHSEKGDQIVKEAFTNLGIVMIIYGFANLGMFIFKPKKVRFFYALTTYFIVPVPVIMFVIDIFKAIVK